MSLGTWMPCTTRMLGGGVPGAVAHRLQPTAPAVSLDDPRLDPLIAACASTGSIALVGAPVAGDDGRSFIGMIAVTGAGVDVIYRKMHLYGDEIHRFSAGEKQAVLEVDDWRLGLAICRDAAVPRHAADTSALTMDVYVASALFGGDTVAAAGRDEQMGGRAAKHGVWSCWPLRRPHRRISRDVRRIGCMGAGRHASGSSRPRARLPGDRRTPMRNRPPHPVIMKLVRRHAVE